MKISRLSGLTSVLDHDKLPVISTFPIRPKSQKYLLFASVRDQMEAEGLLGDIEQLLQQLEHYLGSRVAEGYNPKLKFMSHLWEPIKHVYRCT